MQADAQMSLEHYEAARNEFLAALAIDIGDAAAKAGAEAASKALAADGSGIGSPMPQSPTSPPVITKRQAPWL